MFQTAAPKQRVITLQTQAQAEKVIARLRNFRGIAHTFPQGTKSGLVSVFVVAEKPSGFSDHALKGFHQMAVEELTR